MKSVFLSATIAFALVAPCNAESYFQFERFSKEQKYYYISGYIDSYLEIAANNDEVDALKAFHRGCFTRMGIFPDQMEAAIRSYASRHPEDKGYPVGMMILNTIHELCGEMPK